MHTLAGMHVLVRALFRFRLVVAAQRTAARAIDVARSLLAAARWVPSAFLLLCCIVLSTLLFVLRSPAYLPSLAAACVGCCKPVRASTLLLRARRRSRVLQLQQQAQQAQREARVGAAAAAAAMWPLRLCDGVLGAVWQHARVWLHVVRSLLGCLVCSAAAASRRVQASWPAAW
jgi:hypothetical protein